MSLPPSRLAIGFACAGWATAVSYTLQRLASWARGEIPETSVLAVAHIPFYWRVDVAIFHGLLLGLIGALWLGEHPSGPARLRALILLTVPLCAVSLLCIP
jgi:hypothetical protein